MSLKKIAEELGLSLTTVSRALNGYPEVAKDTQRRAREAATRLGYQANVSARNLALGRSHMVALVFPITQGDLGDTYFLRMAATISERLAEQDIALIIISAKPENELQIYQRTITARHADAFIVARTHTDDARLQLLTRTGTPFIAYGRSNLATPYAWLDFDNEAGGRMAAERFIALGHTALGYLGAPPFYNFAAQRFAGYQRVCANKGLALASQHTVRNAMDQRSGYAAMQQLLSQPNPPTAVLVDNHLAGSGALHAIQHAGLELGRDLSLILYDGLMDDSVIRSNVTAIYQHDETRVGKQLADTVLSLLAGTSPETLQTLWQPSLEPGESDAPAAQLAW